MFTTTTLSKLLPTSTTNQTTFLSSPALGNLSTPTAFSWPFLANLLADIPYCINPILVLPDCSSETIIHLVRIIADGFTTSHFGSIVELIFKEIEDIMETAKALDIAIVDLSYEDSPQQIREEDMESMENEISLDDNIEPDIDNEMSLEYAFVKDFEEKEMRLGTIIKTEVIDRNSLTEIESIESFTHEDETFINENHILENDANISSSQFKLLENRSGSTAVGETLKRKGGIKERFITSSKDANYSRHKKSDFLKTFSNPVEESSSQFKHPNKTNSSSVMEKRKVRKPVLKPVEEILEMSFMPEVVFSSKRRRTGGEWDRIKKDVLKAEVNDDPGFESEDDQLILSCNQCTKSFSSQRKLDLHMTCHENKKVGENAQNPTLLLVHRCSQCIKDRFFTSVASLVSHLESRHTPKDEKKIKCCFPMCFFKNSKDDLIRHIRAKHMKEELFQCNFCVKKLNTYTALKSHEIGHSTSNQCKKCLRFYNFSECFFCKSSSKTPKNDRDLKINPTGPVKLFEDKVDVAGIDELLGTDEEDE